jgi:hypothetical protein
MQTYLTTPTCRVSELSWFLDDDAQPCEPGALLCDHCIQGGAACVPESTPVASHASHEEVAGEANDDDLTDL